MRIIWLHEHLLYWNGGVRWIFEISRRIRARCEVDIYVTKASQENINRFKEVNVNVVELSDTAANDLRYWILYPYYLISNIFKLRRLVTGYDMVIASYPTMCFVLPFLRKKNIHIIFEPNGYVYSDHYLKGLNTLQRLIFIALRPFIKLYDKWATKSAGDIIVLDNHTAQMVEDIYHKQAKTVYVGVDGTFFQRSVNSSLSAKYANCQIILHSSTALNPVKGTRYVLEALPLIIKETPNCKLLIMNPLENNREKEALLSYARELKVDSYIEFLPPLDDELIPCYLSMARVVIQPSVYACAHLPIIESAACQVPAIAFDGISEEDIIDGQTGFIVPKGNINLLAERAIKLIKDDALNKKMGCKAKDMAENSFSWDANAVKMWQIIQNLLSAS